MLRPKNFDSYPHTLVCSQRSGKLIRCRQGPSRLKTLTQSCSGCSHPESETNFEETVNISLLCTTIFGHRFGASILPLQRAWEEDDPLLYALRFIQPFQKCFIHFYSGRRRTTSRSAFFLLQEHERVEEESVFFWKIANRTLYCEIVDSSSPAPSLPCARDGDDYKHECVVRLIVTLRGRGPCSP